MFWLSEQFAPSVPSPTVTPRSRARRSGNRPLPSRMLLPGLCARLPPVSAIRRRSASSSHTPCAAVKSGPTMPQWCICCSSVRPYRRWPTTAWTLLSPTWVCRRRPFSRAMRPQPQTKPSVQWCGMVGATPSRMPAWSQDQWRAMASIAARQAAPSPGRSEFGRPAQVVRQGVEQAGNRLVEGQVGDHRGDDGAHPDLGIGLGDGVHAFAGRQGELGEQVVGGGAALQHHLGGADGGGQLLVGQRPITTEPGRGGEQQFEGPFVALAARQPAMRVHVGVDQARMHQGVRRIERRSRRPERRGRADRSPR